MIKKYKFLFIVLFGLFIFLPKDTFALEIGTVELSGASFDFGTGTTSYTWNAPYYGAFENWGPGYLYFDFSIATKNQSSSTSPFGFSRFVSVTSGGQNYVCHIGTSSVNNSTFVATTYSAKCPMTMGSGGLQQIVIRLGQLGATYESQYTLTLGGLFTYEQASSTIIDNSGTITNDNANTNKITESQKETTEAVKEQTEATKEQTDTIKDSDTSGAEEDASSFFGDFESDDFGLSSIITMPLEFIQGLSSSTCYSLNLPLPFVDTNVTLPCMTSIYQNYFGDFLTLYQIITTGFIAYGVCINIFRLVQGFKNPDNDNVEVMEL